MAPTSAAPSKSPASETAPVDSRDSKSDIGAHMHTGYPSHAGMLRSLLGRSRTGEDEPALALPLVDRETDGIPQLRRHLPFVDEVRLGAFQEHRRRTSAKATREGPSSGILEVHSTFAPAAWPSRSCRTISRRRSERRRKPEAPAEAQRRPRAANSPPVALRPSPPWRAPSINDRSVRLLYHVSEVIAEVGSFFIAEVGSFL